MSQVLRVTRVARVAGMAGMAGVTILVGYSHMVRYTRQARVGGVVGPPRQAGVRAGRGLRLDRPCLPLGERGDVEYPGEEDTGPVLLEHLVANSLVIQHGGLDLQLRRLENELHEREFVASVKFFCLNFYISLVDSESFSQFDVRDEKSEFCIKIEQQNP